MTAKEWLSRGRLVDIELKRLEAARKVINDRLTSATQNYDSDGSQSTKDPHKFDRIAEINHEIDSWEEELRETQKEIEAMIHRISDPRCRIAFITYFLGGARNWDVVADVLHYSRSHMKRIRKDGYKIVDGLLASDKDKMNLE